MDIPFDPDFDSLHATRRALDGLKPSAAFLFGFTVAIAIVSVVGLLIMFFR